MRQKAASLQFRNSCEIIVNIAGFLKGNLFTGYWFTSCLSSKTPHDPALAEEMLTSPGAQGIHPSKLLPMGLCFSMSGRKFPGNHQPEFRSGSSLKLADGSCKDGHQNSQRISMSLLSVHLSSQHPPNSHYGNLEVRLLWDTFVSLCTLHTPGDLAVTHSYFSIEPFVSRCLYSFCVI